MSLDFLNTNRVAWNAKTPVNIQSVFYDNESFLKGRNTLSDIELNLLGNVAGKRILHLQCHFGQDTISLARMGANVTGIDFSEKAIEAARGFAEELNVEVRFICCNIYDLTKYLHESFDIVFTSYGTIGWLPDLDKWADIIHKCLTPGGRFIFVEFHPVVWMFNDDFTNLTYRYFNSEPIIENSTGTYADRNAQVNIESVGWNHGIGEVLTSLLSHGMEINSFEEYDYSPANCFLNMTEDEPGKFRIKNFGNKIPIVYSVTARRS